MLQIRAILQDNVVDLDHTILEGSFTLPASGMASLWVALIQVAAAYVCYGCSKFACKILIQQFSFSFALSLVGPVLVNILIYVCGVRNANPCAFHGTVPDYLNLIIPPGMFNLLLFIIDT